MKSQAVIHRKNILFFTIGLSLLTIMGILGVDTYLPSIPDIAKEFRQNIPSMQLSIMVYTLCIGFGQLILAHYLILLVVEELCFQVLLFIV